jgi:hypothetical protein
MCFVYLTSTHHSELVRNHSAHPTGRVYLLMVKSRSRMFRVRSGEYWSRGQSSRFRMSLVAHESRGRSWKFPTFRTEPKLVGQSSRFQMSHIVLKSLGPSSRFLMSLEGHELVGQNLRFRILSSRVGLKYPGRSLRYLMSLVGLKCLGPNSRLRMTSGEPYSRLQNSKFRTFPPVLRFLGQSSKFPHQASKKESGRGWRSAGDRRLTCQPN